MPDWQRPVTSIQHQHLDYYLDEFTFRFNRRRSLLKRSPLRAVT